MALELCNICSEWFKDPIIKYVVRPTKRHIGYAFTCDRNVDKLSHQTNHLTTKKVRLQQSVDQAEKNGEQIYENVTNWLSRAETETQQAQAIIGGKEQAKMDKCFVGLCPNLKSRYQLSKQADKKALAIDKLRNEEGLDSISFRPPPQQIVEPSVYSREALPSRVLILKQVMDALKDPNLHMIGVYGMGGVGKTTLAKEVYRKAVDDKLFDSVVRVVVSKSPNLSSIQAEIAYFLELKFDVDEVPHARASRLNERLKKSKVLVILDDIWEKLDLNSIGIPSGHGCKLLLTSRSKEVLSTEMGTQQEVSIDCLTEEEAWRLFHLTVANAIDPKLQEIAIEVAQKCAGLPLLILQVAVKLQNKELYAWNDMLKQLSDFSNEGKYGKVRRVLESSYHNLHEKEKSIFLLCSLCGRSNIWIRDLVRYSMGMGLFTDICTIEEVRNRVLTLINELIAKSLLLNGDMEGCVKMHDVVRDITLQVACEVENVFIGRSGVRSRECPTKDCTKISLPFCDNNNLLNGLECPEVELFLMFTEDSKLQISDSIFEGIRKLKVVDFTGIHFRSLPSSLGFQTNLRTLCLEECQLNDVANIGQLKELECLSFRGSNIVELPREMEQLSQLKLLDLSNCNKLIVIPPNILSKLSPLEELYMGDNSFVGWDVEGNARLMELEELSRLTSLEIQVIDPKKIPNRLFSKRLQRYRIFIGDEWKWGEKYETSRALKLTFKTDIHLEPGLKELLKGAETLYMGKVRGIENGLYDLGGESYQQLKHLQIQDDNVIRHVIDSTKWGFCHAFPTLETLFLDNLNSLGKLSSGQLTMGSFSNLRLLKINRCHKLTNLFSFFFAKYLVQLQGLEVKNCSNMIAIIIAEESNDANYNNEEIEFPQLCSLTLSNLPCLRSISYPKKVSSETEIAQSQITTEDALFSKMVSFPNLTSLYIGGCDSLRYICKASTIKNLLQLKELEICHCELVEEIILTEEFEESMDKIIFPNLNFLSLRFLPRCNRFSNGYPIEFQSLTGMKLHRCYALKSLVSNISNIDMVNNDTCDDIQSLFNEMVTFPNLQIMHIGDMDNLENIWHTQHPPDSFPNLQSLTISECQKLLTVFPSNVFLRFQRLEKLEISYLSSLKGIWSDEDADGVFTFQTNLKSLDASYCNSLEYVFPASIVCGPLQQLKTLEISDCGALKHIVGKGKREEEPYSFHFPHLTILQLRHLHRFKSFYEGRHAFNCPKLEHLEIRHCPEAKISSYQEPNTEGHHTVPILQPLLSFDKANPNLKTLKLDCKILKAMQISIEQCSILKEIELYAVRYRDCDFLSGFLSKRLYNLEKLVIAGSSLQELFLLDASIVILKCLVLDNIKILKHIWMEDLWLQNLTTLHIVYCRELENLVTVSTAKSMVCLVELRIEDCEIMKEVVANDGNHVKHHIIFNQLKILKLKNLPVLNSFCSENYTFNFPLLEQVTVEKCWQMKIFCGGAFTTPKLQGIRHEEYGKELYWQGNVNATLASLSTKKDVLLYARSWHVIKDATSQKVLIANQLQFLHNLNVINVRDCDSIQVVFDLEEVFVEDGHAGLLPKLKELKLINLPMLSQLWNKDPLGILDFKQLFFLKVQNCSILKYALTSSMASSLVALTMIIVENCEMMEAIIKEEAKERVKLANKLILPSLASLHLKSLPKLSSLYSGNGILKCPSLKEIYIKECPSMKGFVSSLSSIQSPTTDDRMVHQIAISSLKKMSIEWELIKDKLESNNQPDFLHRLKVLELIGFEGEFVAFPSNKSFPNMKTFVLSDSLVEKIIADEVNKDDDSLWWLSKVKLSTLPNLKQLVDVDDPKMVSFFQNLEELEVWECNKLEIVVPCSVPFRNLTYLKVSKCDELINLITTATAMSLVHLKTMHVSECKMMREIVAIESDGKEDYQIGFSRLKTLVLVNLPCLISFCSANYAFNFPYLNRVAIEDCPNMKMFAQQVLNTPQLTKVYVKDFDEWEWEGSLNNTVQALFLEKNMFSQHEEETK